MRRKEELRGIRNGNYGEYGAGYTVNTTGEDEEYGGDNLENKGREYG